MAKAARSKRLRRFSITEHISQFKGPRNSISFGSVHNSGRMFRDFDEYLLEFETLDGFSQSVNRGLEVDYSPRFITPVSEFVNKKKWDILLLSVHELGNRLDVENKNLPQDADSSRARWNEYFELEKEALRSDSIQFHVLTHPIRLARSTQRLPENIDELLYDLAKLARDEGKALELNGNDITRDYVLVEKLASACSETSCEVSFGSDAHHPNEVGRGYDRALELVKKFDLSEKLNFS
jgi:histidinol-phosphatase (PHP family)